MPALDHIGLEVLDLFPMERFYRTVLGFRLDYRYESRNTPGLRTVFLERDGLRLELLARPRDPGAPAPGGAHLALAVPDVDGEYRRLAGLGLPDLGLEPPRTTGDGYREAALRDPEGNRIELCARVAPAPRRPVRAVIFDLDGTLIDSEPNYYLADRQLLARFGIDFSEADKRQYIGGSNLAEMRDLVRRFGLAAAPEDLAREKDRLYLAIAEHATRVFPAMRAFLDRVLARGLPVAVASGSSAQVIRRLLAAVGLDGPFRVAVSAEEVAHGKPAPDGFLEAARRLGVPPAECLVVEDACPGVEAARRAFMRCIAVPTLTDPPLPATFALADLVFPAGMGSFDPGQAWAWVEGQGLG